MKKILLSTVALVGLTAGAMAADLPVRTMAPPPVVAVPVFTWTGFYAGVNAGYAFHTNEDDDFFDSDDRGRLRTTAPGRGTFPVRPAGGGSFLRNNGGNEDGGFTGGGQVGYNMQFGMFVLGIEADAQYVDLGDGQDNRINNRNGFGTAALQGANVRGNPFGIRPVQGGAAGNVFFRDTGNVVEQSDFFGTVRGRLGLAFDRTMIYVTGGLAYTVGGDDDEDGVRRGGVPGRNFFVDAAAARRGARNLARANGDNDGGGDDSDFGWTIGGGVEYAFSNNISAKIEGLYVNFDRDDNGGGSRVVGVTNTGARIRQFGGDQNNDDFAVVRAGLNFRFGTF